MKKGERYNRQKFSIMKRRPDRVLYFVVYYIIIAGDGSKSSHTEDYIDVSPTVGSSVGLVSVGGGFYLDVCYQQTGAWGVGLS